MTKDDDLPAASGGAPSRRALPGHGRKTAPIGTPAHKLPIEIPPAAAPAPPPMPVKPARSERPPSSSQNTLSPPRTVGGHTARLLRGEPLDDDEPESIEPSRGARPRVQDRSARGRPPPLDEADDTVSRGGAKANAAPAATAAAAARGGTVRMDATDQPAGPAQAASPPARKPPPAPPPPLSPDPISEDLPSTARGGSARDLYDPAVRQLPGQVVAPHPAAPPLPATPPLPAVTSAPTGEITITGSEFEQTTIPREEIESRWPFAFAVGAVSLAIGSLIPLPFRQYIVPDRSGAVGAASASASAPVASAKPIATPDLVQPTAPPPHTATAAPPSSFVPQVGGGATAPTAVRTPPPFGSVKVPRTNPTTPRDIF